MQFDGCVNNMIINAQAKLNIEQDFKIQAGPGAGKLNFGESYHKCNTNF